MHLHRTRYLLLALVAAVAVFGLVVVAPSGNTPAVSAADDAVEGLRVTFLFMGHGDAALYEAWCGEAGLIDVGRGGADEVLAALDRRGSRHLDWVVATHYHGDHIADIPVVARSSGVRIDRLYDGGGGPDDGDTSSYDDYYGWVESGATVREPVDTGDSFTLCGATPNPVTFDVISMGTDGTAAHGLAVLDENDKSMCLAVAFGDFDLATCGDLTGTTVDDLRDTESAVAADLGEVEVAKANHHGHRYSSNATYVSTLSPAAAIISVGTNKGGSPDPAVLARWDEVGDVYQTGDPATGGPRDGNVVVTTTGIDTFEVTTSASDRETSYPLDEATAPAASTPSSAVAAEVFSP